MKDFNNSKPRPLSKTGFSQVCPLFESKPKDNRPYVTIELFGRPYLSLLDTGASVSVFGRGMECFLGNLDPHLFSLEGVPKVTVADGNIQQVGGSITIPVVFGDRTRDITFVIVPAISHPIILGSDFCREFGVRLNFSELTYDLALIDQSSASVVDSGEAGGLTLVQQRRLAFTANKFKELSSKAPGRTNLAQHYIDTGDARPIKQRQYPISPALQVHLNGLIDEMLEQGVIEPSTSPWSSPILLVKKKDDSFRLCFDGRKLNEVTVKDSYPLPLIDSILKKVGNAKYISSLDLTKAFWNVPLEESSKAKTAFQVHGKGLFHFRMMPFGLCNSAQTLQRLMDTILGPELDPYVFCYLDDIVVVTESFEKHLDILHEVHRRLEKSGLKINFEKCKFARDSLSFLGFVIDKQGLKTDPDKVRSILETPIPRNTTEVRGLIGVLQWYRRFIKDFSTVSEPITSLIKGNRKRLPIVWTQEADDAFKALKQQLVSAPILVSPDFTQPFYIQTDASDVGLGAVLFQVRDGFEHPIAFASRKLTKCEKKYSVTEKECLGALFGVEKFRGYVEGTDFTLITDHASLIWLTKLKDPMGRLARWTCRLSSFKFNIVHRKGSLNVVADFLSRQISAVEVRAQIEDLVPDEWYKQMLDKVEQQPERYPDFCKVDNVLYKHFCSTHGVESNLAQWKLVVPTENRKALLREMHDSATAAHLGVTKTHARIFEYYYWPGMRKDIRHYVKTCQICGAHKSSCQSKPGLMGRFKEVSMPFQAISLDFMGPFPRSKKGNTQLLVVTDWFTKFVLVQPVPKATSKNVIKFLEQQVFLLFGVPQIIMCDNGVQFTSNDFKRFVSEYGIEKVWYNARYHAQVNPTERVNKILGSALASYIKEDHKLWDQHVFQIAHAIRTAKHEVTGFTPAFLTFGRNLPLRGSFYGHHPNPDLESVPIADNEKWRTDLEKLPKIYKDVYTQIEKSHNRNAQRYNLRRRPVKFVVGDRVWKRNFILSDAGKNFAKKLAPKYVPCIVKRIKGSGLVYELVDLNGKSVGDFHIQDLKPYYDRDE